MSVSSTKARTTVSELSSMLYPHYVTAAGICGCSIKVVEGVKNYFQLHCTEEENFQNNQIFLGFRIFSSAPKFKILPGLESLVLQLREIEECGNVEAACHTSSSQSTDYHTTTVCQG